MANQIKLPNLGENIESGDVLSILVSEGDTVKKDQDLLEIETDKATMPVPSPSAGKITKILVSEGDTIEVGAAIMEIEADGAEESKTKEKKPSKKKEPVREEEETSSDEDEAESAEAAEEKPAKTDAKQKKKQPEPEAEPEEPPAKKSATARQIKQAAARAPQRSGDENVPGDGHAASAAGPAVRRLARQLGVELRQVRPTGEGGRITADDVQTFVRETQEQAAAAAPRGVTPPGSPDTDEFGGVRVEKMSRIRQTIARNMVLSYTTIPQLTNFDDVDVTELEDMRNQSKDDYAQRGIKLTSMSFLVKAAASSLKRHPIVNASVDMEHHQVIYKEYVNIGFAVDTERGLMVPVIQHADRKTISQIAAEVDRLATMARNGELGLDDMRGGTFTISNLGAVGGTYSTPIINPPEVAILLAGRSRTMPQIVEDAVESRLVMPLSLTYDHRVVDGAAAARFLNEVKGYLAAPGRLLLAP